MSLFVIDYEDDSYFVEADGMEAAIVTWREATPKFCGDETPETVALLTDQPVIRQIEVDHSDA